MPRLYLNQSIVPMVMKILHTSPQPVIISVFGAATEGLCRVDGEKWLLLMTDYTGTKYILVCSFFKCSCWAVGGARL